MKRSRAQARHRRHLRARGKLQGNASRPRMAVHFSGKHIRVQFIDDQTRRTLAAVSTLEKDFRADGKRNHSNVEAAKKIGALAAQRARAQNITTVVFDRGGFRYHGRVAALAEAARAAGLKF